MHPKNYTLYMEKSINGKVVWKELHDYLMIAVGLFLCTVGWTVFMLPNHITTGGTAGLASVVFWGTGIPVEYTYIVINGILLLIALKVLGFKFCVKTMYAIVVITIFMHYGQKLTSDVQMLHDQLFLAAVLGGCFWGAGIGMALSVNGSTGGTDIVAAMINKYRDISLGHALLITDLLIITSGYLVFRSWEQVIYGYVVLYISTFMIDQVVNLTRSSVQFFIISKKHEEIGHQINEVAQRGCTVINGSGFYSGEEVKMLFVLAKKSESGRIFSLINEIDPNAFVSQSAVIGVYGLGFDKIKQKRRKSSKHTNE